MYDGIWTISQGTVFSKKESKLELVLKKTFFFSQLEQVLNNTWHIRSKRAALRSRDLSHPRAFRTWSHEIGPVP
jgi:hypothetical protein